MLSKEMFIEGIETLKTIFNFQNDLTDVTEKYNADFGIMDFPDGVEYIIKMLNKEMNVEMNDLYGSDIEYFIFDLDFGKKYYPGIIIDNKGHNIDFSTAEKLYDYLVREYGQK